MLMLDTKLVEEPRTLVKLFFNVDITPTQEEILKDILLERHNRIIISAMTRWGKSYIVAMGVLLYAILHDGKTNAIIAPTYKQARIIMDHIGSFIVE